MRFCLTLASTVLNAVLTTATLCHAGEPVRLLLTVAEWQYPGSKINGASMEDAATVNRSGANGSVGTVQNRADHEGPDGYGDRVL